MVALDFIPLKKGGLFKATSLKGGRSGRHTLKKGAFQVSLSSCTSCYIGINCHLTFFVPLSFAVLYTKSRTVVTYLTRIAYNKAIVHANNLLPSTLARSTTPAT